VVQDIVAGYTLEVCLKCNIKWGGIEFAERTHLLTIIQLPLVVCGTSDFSFTGANLNKDLVIPAADGGGALDQIWTVADYGAGWCSNWQFKIQKDDGSAVDPSIVSVSTTGVMSVNDDVPSTQTYKLIAEYVDGGGSVTSTLEKTNIIFTVSCAPAVLDETTFIGFNGEVPVGTNGAGKNQ
jgi:hypothetical protein